MSRIDRKNRERKGGMKSSGLPLSFEGDGIMYYTSVEREFLKRTGRKAMRRQHKKAIALAHAEMESDFQEDMGDTLRGFEEYEERVNWSDYNDVLDDMAEDEELSFYDPYYDERELEFMDDLFDYSGY